MRRREREGEAAVLKRARRHWRGAGGGRAGGRDEEDDGEGDEWD